MNLKPLEPIDSKVVSRRAFVTGAAVVSAMIALKIKFGLATAEEINDSLLML